MSFFKKLFSNTADKIKEGDIFYTYFDKKYHLYKLLKFDKELDAFHVLSYIPISKLPNRNNLTDLKIAIYHSPVAKKGFTNLKLFLQGPLNDNDLIGYYEYLRQTQNIDELIIRANNYYQEAHRLTDEKNYYEAIDKYSKAIELIPGFFEAIDNRAFCKMDLGQWNEAIADFEQSLLVNPNSLLAEFSIGECYLRLGDYNKAKERFKRAVTIDPTHQPSKDFLKKATDLITHNIS